MQFLSKKDVRERTTLSFAQIDRLEKSGRFPKRRHIGFRVVWIESEVLEWMRERAA
jgi:predicted DNA-binding transcriptional regulator AlpA